MKRLAITGGLCSGKTTVSQLLRARGCPVVDADAVGHELLATAAKPLLLQRFGTAEPARLAELVFAPGASPALADLNRILHPMIMERAHAQLRVWEQQGLAMAGVEAALLIEAGLLPRFDCVVLVVAERERRIARFRARTGGTRAQAEARMAHQLPDEVKMRQADVVIDNNGSEAALDLQVGQLLAGLRAGVAE